MGLFDCFSPILRRNSSLSTSSSYDSFSDDKLDADDHHAVRFEDHAELNLERRDDDDGGGSDVRLAALRREMQEDKIDVYCVPTADAHGSEYVGECDKRRAWLSGFSGSAGVAVITTDEALMFTDSRYYIQAGKQLGPSWTLQKVGEKDVKNWDAWLLTLPEGTRIGLDPTQTDYDTTKSLLAKLEQKKLVAVFSADNLVDRIWTDRPPRSKQPIMLHSLKFTGRSAQDKLADLRQFLNSSDSVSSTKSSFILSALNNIAWLLNLRGSDIEFSPFFYAYLLVPASKDDKFSLWVQAEAVNEELRSYIDEIGGVIKSYESALDDLRALESDRAFACDGKMSWAIAGAVGLANLTVVKSPVTAAEAIKNQVEIEGFKAAYRRDGAAWVRWAAWLEEAMKAGEQISEWDAAEKLTAYRKSGESFAGLAYDNISATGQNAALPHYAPTAKSSSIIDRHTPYLNDSGAQYLDGTIDTTRTVHFGKPTSEHKRAFTRVLQGHIAVDSLVFPEGTTGGNIDALARRPLWSEGMSFAHGTGHGVGQYLSVHEGPQGISSRSDIPFVPGHLTSNEPAYYEAGSYGIRTESVIFVKEVKTRRAFGDMKWLGFERLTMVPIQTRMVDWALLSKEEKGWLKAHNDTCRKSLMPLIKHDKRAVKYLSRQ